MSAAGIAHDEEASTLDSRKRRTQNHGDLEHVQLGELSAGRMALEGEDLASRIEATLFQLRQRPARPQDPLPPGLVHFEPANLFSLDKDKFAANLRSSRRGTAGGLSGIPSDHSRELHLFFRVAELLARDQGPESVASVLRRGRMTALQKPGGGARGNVAGDVVRRLVARTISQLLDKALEGATAPFQYALSTIARCECVAHALQAMTDLDPESTILSIDGISAYDFISRRAMLSGWSRVKMTGALSMKWINEKKGSWVTP